MSSSISVNPESSKNYLVTVTDEKGCSNYKSIAVSVDGPIADFNASRPVIHKGDFVTFNISMASEFVSYNWTFGDGFNSSIDNPLHYYNILGNFDVALTVTSKNNCTSTFKKENCINVVADDVSLNEFLEMDNMSVLVYPVPFRDDLYVTLENYKPGDVVIASITDMAGRVIIQKKLMEDVNKIQGEDLISGMYILKINVNEVESSRKIIKE